MIHKILIRFKTGILPPGNIPFEDVPRRNVIQSGKMSQIKSNKSRKQSNSRSKLFQQKKALENTAETINNAIEKG